MHFHLLYRVGQVFAIHFYLQYIITEPYMGYTKHRLSALLDLANEPMLTSNAVHFHVTMYIAEAKAFIRNSDIDVVTWNWTALDASDMEMDHTEHHPCVSCLCFQLVIPIYIDSIFAELLYSYMYPLIYQHNCNMHFEYLVVRLY